MLQLAGPFRRELRSLTAEIAAFGRETGAQAVWQVMDTPPLIAMGPAVADALGVPLFSLVWDAPDYILRKLGWARFCRRRMLAQFARTITRSRRVAVVSREMSEDYTRLGARECVTLRFGFPRDQLRSPRRETGPSSGITIGFAGSLYAVSAWDAFFRALDRLEWQIGGRPVTVRLIGGNVRLHLQRRCRVECVGWPENAEVLELLADCDVNYLPHPFEPGLADLARLSFPTKLSTYVAAGVPVFVHAPSHSSLAGFYADYPTGAFCASLEPEVIARELTELVSDPGRLQTAAGHAARAAQEELNRDVFLSRFAQLLGLPGGNTAPPRVS